MTEIRSVLVANRGEIAARVFRTCRELGIRTVAVYTAADAAMPYVRWNPWERADESVAISSYLATDEILAAAKRTGADAIHPGYGFLSENAGFARAVAEAGLTWIGPSADVIDKMGRKDAAREIATAAGVPVVPSYALDADPETFNYPVLAKAAAGGGGTGMRVVTSAGELTEAIAAAKREALSAFGDDTMIIEKYVERGRHIEVQVFGDSTGEVIHLATRDCSAQRRHQKVVEEAPAPDLADSTRERMHDAAVALGRAVGYTNAGTVEFLLDSDTGDFYFLEMNTRLQVEHPVTEEVTGIDLVEWQLLVAAGASMPGWDGEVDGHAIEVRVYAEDPYHGFLPQAGTLIEANWPDESRVETVYVERAEVSTSYDPMLAKIIAIGRDRRAAREHLISEIDTTSVIGLTTNLGYLRRLVASAEFAAGPVHTGWLESPDAADLLVAPDIPDFVGEKAAFRWVESRSRPGAMSELDGWRSAGPAEPALVSFEVDGVVRSYVARRTDELIFVQEEGRRSWATHQGHTWSFAEPDPFRAHGAATGDGTIAAPMPGTVLDVRVAEGEQVAEGTVLGVLEAMKMELALKAPYDGRVSSVAAAVGQQVTLGAVLFVVEAADADA